MRKLLVSAFALLSISSVFATEANIETDKPEVKNEAAVVKNEANSKDDIGVDKIPEISKDSVVLKDNEDLKGEAKESDIKPQKDEVNDNKTSEPLKEETSKKEEEKKSKEPEDKKNDSNDKLSETSKVVETPKDELMPAAKEDSNAPMLEVSADKLLKSANLVSSCLNPECLISAPVQTESGWIIPLKITEDLFSIISKKDGTGLSEVLVKKGDCDQAISKALSIIISKINISDKDIEYVKDLKISELDTFSGALTELGLMERYASKIGESKESKRSVAAIPLEYSDGKLIINFKNVESLLQNKIGLAKEVEAAKNSIAPIIEERNKKISPEMQKGLDELFALESENKNLAEQIEADKKRVEGDVAAAEKEMADAAMDKASVEEAKNSANAKLSASQGELDSAKNNSAAKQRELSAAQSIRNRRTKTATISRVTGEINSFNAAAAAAEGRVNSAKTEIADAESKIAAADGRSAAATVKIANLTTGYKTLEARITANNARISELNSSKDITRAKVYAGDSDSAIDSIVDKLKGLFDRLLEA